MTSPTEEFKQREEAIPLVYVDKDDPQNFKINPEATAFISSVEKPVAIVSVAGMYRTGKSYLLNRVVLNRSEGFGVGNTINPHTKGIWIWGKVFKGQTVDNQIVNILVLDTEGIGALDEDSNHDSRIFA